MKKLRVVDAHACNRVQSIVSLYALQKAVGIQPRMASIRVFKNEEEGIDTPIICRQCENAPCVEACPTRALARDDGPMPW